MSEIERFIGGNNGAATPLELLLHTTNRTASYEFPDDSIRSEVLQEALGLCRRFDQDRPDIRAIASGTFMPHLYTPPTEYVSSRSGRSALIWLAANATQSKNPEPNQWYIRLRARVAQNPEEELYKLSAHEFKCAGIVGAYPGTRGELNIFRGIIDRIRATHFPKT